VWFDGAADFDAALRDSEIPTQMRAVDDCGDGLHPSDGGYSRRAMVAACRG
jgi:lysophospholipase L1-like esterase